MEPIQVAIRIRPFLPYENEYNTTIDISNEDDRKVYIQKGNKKFNGYFDKIFSQKSTQENVFKFISPIFKSIYKGINTTILAYGQTGSGKTYTMFGGNWTEQFEYYNRKNNNYKRDEFNFLIDKQFIIDPYSHSNGIIPRIITELFNNINNNIKISCSYIQVYNEKIYDLLIDDIYINKKKNFELGNFNNRTDKIIDQEPLKLREDAKKGVIIDGAYQMGVYSFYDVFQLLKMGEKNRKKRQTNKNDMSSRSHTIFIIYYEDKLKRVSSKITLCDLAGSEKYDQKENYKLVHFNELKSINKSLSILGNVIHALSLKRPTHIPYKDSTLTHLLKDSIGGNCKTYLIANISPNYENFDESINTLYFADRAHEIESKLSPNYVDTDNDEYDDPIENKTIKKLSNEVRELRQLLKLRTKRGTLEPIQEEFIKLKEENSQLKKYMNNPNNNNLMNLIKENEYLKKEIQKLTSNNNSYTINSNTNTNISNTNSNISNSNNIVGKDILSYNSYNNNLRSNIINYKSYDLKPKNKKKNIQYDYDNNETFSNVGSKIISDFNYTIKQKKPLSPLEYKPPQTKSSSRTYDSSINSKLIEITNKRLKIFDEMQKKNEIEARRMIEAVKNKKGNYSLSQLKLENSNYFDD